MQPIIRRQVFDPSSIMALTTDKLEVLQPRKR